jgi:hypothetical protein
VTTEALTLLQSIYEQFTEGFGTPDLIQAKALLEEFRANSVNKKAETQVPGSAD